MTTATELGLNYLLLHEHHYLHISGFLGHCLLQDLHAKYGDAVTLYSASRTQRYSSEYWKWIRCDLTSTSMIREALEQTGAKTVIHASAAHFESSREEAFMINVDGTQAVVDACLQAGVKRLVYTSSTTAIFKGRDLINAYEDEPYVSENDAKSYYGLSKAKGEIIVMDANGKEGMYTTAVRPASFTGPGDTTFLAQAMSVLRNRQAFVQIGQNDNYCDFDHVDNVNHCMILACEQLLDPSNPSLPGPAAGEIFHVTSDDPVPLWTYMRKMWYEYNGYQAWFNVIIPYWLAYILAVMNELVFGLFGGKATGLTRDTLIYATVARTHNIDKAKKLLGYRPVMGVDEGLKQAVAWYREEEAKQRLARAKAKHEKRRKKAD